MKKLLKTLLVAAICVAWIPALAKTPRSQAARYQFAKSHACPSTGQNKLPCPGYVIDHVTALACGGADKPSNMQWQTIAEGKAKDRWETKGCRQ